jgi:hypothetical protein
VKKERPHNFRIGTLKRAKKVNLALKAVPASLDYLELPVCEDLLELMAQMAYREIAATEAIRAIKVSGYLHFVLFCQFYGPIYVIEKFKILILKIHQK